MKRFLIFVGVVMIAVLLYCIEIVSVVTYNLESTAAVNAVLQQDNQDPLSTPAVAPLVDIVRKDKSEFAAQSVQSLLDLRSIAEPASIKEFSDRIQSTKAKVTFGVSDATLNKWRDTAANIQSADEAQKRQEVLVLKQAINRVIVSALIPPVPASTLKQYSLIKSFIPSLPDLPQSGSTSADTP